MNLLIMEAVQAAGGTKRVASARRITDEAGRRWSSRGLPRTEWTGETSYLVSIEALQKAAKPEKLITAEQIKAAQVWD